MPDDGPGENVKQDPAQQPSEIKLINPPAPPNNQTTQDTKTISQQGMASEIHGLEDRIRGAEKWMIGLTGGIVLLTAGIVIVGVLQWNAMLGQLDEMRDQQAPWIGLEDNAISIDPTPTFYWGVPAAKFPSISIGVSFAIRNVGSAPGLRENHNLWVLPYQNGVPATDQMAHPCDFAEMRTKIPGAANPAQGQMILPGGRVPVRDNPNLLLDQSKPTRVQALWVFVCVVYQDSRQKTHHSRYWYLTAHGNQREIPVSGHPEWSYVPNIGLSLWGASAD